MGLCSAAESKTRWPLHGCQADPDRNLTPTQQAVAIAAKRISNASANSNGRWLFRCFNPTDSDEAFDASSQFHSPALLLILLVEMKISRDGPSPQGCGARVDFVS